MREGVLEAGGLHADAVAVGDGLDTRDLLAHRGLDRRVFEVGAADEGAGAVGAADDDVESALLGHRHHALERAVVVEQRVAAGEKEAVGARAVEGHLLLDRLHAVDAEAPGLDHAFVVLLGALSSKR